MGETRKDGRPIAGEFLPGTLDMLILKTVSRGTLHGYAIAQFIQQASREVLRVEEGALYPALHRLEHQGWIAAKWGQTDAGRRAKYYSLTRAGRHQLGREAEQWRRLSVAVTTVVDTV